MDIIFRDTFESLVHNNDTLTNIEKFHYLKSSLSRMLHRVLYGLSTFLRITTRLRGRNSKTVSRTKNKICSLGHTCIEEEIILWTETVVGRHEIIIIHLMTTKLDTVTKREWEKAQFAITGDVKLSDLTKFLEAECRYLKRVKAEKPLLLVQ